MLDDQWFIVPRKVEKEKELRKPSPENVISPNHFELLSCNKNENENLDHRDKYKSFNQIDFKVILPTFLEKNSNDGSIIKTLYVGNLNKNVTDKDLIELFGLQTTNYLGNTCHVKLILCSKTDNSGGFAFVTGPEHVLNDLIKLNGIAFQEKVLVLDEAKKEVIDTFINTIKGNSSRCHSRIPAFNPTPDKLLSTEHKLHLDIKASLK